MERLQGPQLGAAIRKILGPVALAVSLALSGGCSGGLEVSRQTRFGCPDDSRSVAYPNPDYTACSRYKYETVDKLRDECRKSGLRAGTAIVDGSLRWICRNPTSDSNQ